MNFYSEEVAQGQQIWPLQHPPTAAMEVTERKESRVISSKTQKWKVILETKISDQLKKTVSKFHKQDLLFRCCSWVYSLMCKSDDMDAEVFFRRTFSNREVEGICGLTCDNKLADRSSQQVMIKRGSSPVDWKTHVQAARLHVRHLVVAHSWTTLWLRGAGGQLWS